ncbi:DUF4291 family protein [Sorangium sp. So ce406]|uniref:DUF4291 family protein n=1 Tax=Sorangium sp. So ce406 TaxID=3133311 RepID=UPI003F5C5B6A
MTGTFSTTRGSLAEMDPFATGTGTFTTTLTAGEPQSSDAMGVASGYEGTMEGGADAAVSGQAQVLVVGSFPDGKVRALSDVRLQWDPDHDPSSAPVARRAIQLGLRGAMLRRFADEWTVGVEDISKLVAEQREVLRGRGARELVIPREEVYWPADADGARRVGIERWVVHEAIDPLLGLDPAAGGTSRLAPVAKPAAAGGGLRGPGSITGF